MTDIILSTQNGEPVASSRDVAKRFGKEHKDVLRAIKSITAQNCAVTQMFYQSEYTAGTGKKYPMYLMNRDGFSLLAMGFTGKEAMQWKLKYIEAFNQMEQAALCTALVAGICMDSKDPAETIINIMTAAADLMDRMEETHQ